MRACGPTRHMEECAESHNTIRVVRLGTVILIHITVYIVYAPLLRLFFSAGAGRQGMRQAGSRVHGKAARAQLGLATSSFWPMARA